MPRTTEAEILAMRNKIYMTVQESVIGAGTGNYNKLENVPIVNLSGESESSVIVLSGLNQGLFTLSGYYKPTTADEPIYQDGKVDLQVQIEKTVDPENPEGPPKEIKVAFFPYVKNGNIYIKKYVFDGDTIVSQNDIQVGAAFASNQFKVFKLPAENWNGTEEDGGREWYTQTIPIQAYHTEVVNAVACGESIDQFSTEEQEAAIANMKAYLYMDDMTVKFYSIGIPSMDLYVALEGIE